MARRTGACMNVDRLAGTDERYPWVRAVKAFVVIACGVVPAIVFAMMIVDAMTLELYAGQSVKYGLIVSAFFLAPAGLYAALIRTKFPIVVVGVGLIAIDAWSIWNVVTSTSSTGALAILTIPFLGIPFVLLGWAVDVWIRAMWPVSPPP